MDHTGKASTKDVPRDTHILSSTGSNEEVSVVGEASSRDTVPDTLDELAVTAEDHSNLPKELARGREVDPGKE